MYVSGILPHFYKSGCLILEFSNKNLGARSLLSRPFSGRRRGWWKEWTPMQRGMVELVTTMDHSPTGGCLRNHIECISKLSLWWFWDIHTDPHISLAVGCFHRQWPSNTCGPSLLCWTAFLDVKEGKKKKKQQRDLLVDTWDEAATPCETVQPTWPYIRQKGGDMMVITKDWNVRSHVHPSAWPLLSPADTSLVLFSSHHHYTPKHPSFLSNHHCDQQSTSRWNVTPSKNLGKFPARRTPHPS